MQRRRARSGVFFDCMCYELLVLYFTMKWFWKYVHFSKDYTDILQQLLEYSQDINMLNSIVTYTKHIP